MNAAAAKWFNRGAVIVRLTRPAFAGYSNSYTWKFADGSYAEEYQPAGWDDVAKEVGATKLAAVEHDNGFVIEYWGIEGLADALAQKLEAEQLERIRQQREWEASVQPKPVDYDEADEISDDDLAAANAFYDSLDAEAQRMDDMLAKALETATFVGIDGDEEASIQRTLSLIDGMINSVKDALYAGERKVVQERLMQIAQLAESTANDLQ